MAKFFGFVLLVSLGLFLSFLFSAGVAFIELTAVIEGAGAALIAFLFLAFLFVWLKAGWEKENPRQTA